APGSRAISSKTCPGRSPATRVLSSSSSSPHPMSPAFHTSSAFMPTPTSSACYPVTALHCPVSIGRSLSLDRSGSNANRQALYRSERLIAHSVLRHSASACPIGPLCKHPVRRPAMLLSLVFTLVALLTLDFGVASAQPPRQATFELRNEIKIKVPDGAQRMRVWVALPQDNDPAQQVRDLKIEAPYAYRIERDSEGSRVLYLEAANPKDKEVTIVETFGLIRREIRDQVDASKARPLTDADRARFA